MTPADLGLDPAVYFLDAAGRPEPLAVRHDTGAPEFVVRGGRLEPYAAPARSATPGAGRFDAGRSGFQFTAAVTPPGA